MIKIRQAAIGDARLIADIGGRAFVESHGSSAAPADIADYLSRRYTPEAMERELTQPSNLYYVVYFDGLPAGYSNVVLNKGQACIPEANIACLDRIYLLREHYGKGIGVRLLQFNIDLSQRAGQAGMWLYTWTGNERAIRFYEKAGFRIVGAADFKISETHSNPNHVMYLRY